MLLSYYVAQDWDVIPLHSEGTPRYVKDKHTHQWTWNPEMVRLTKK